MITITDLEKSHGARTLFRDVSLQLVAEGKYGVVGANGSGKSSLLRIIAGEEEASNGSVTIPRKARVGVLGQDHFRYETTPILDVVMMGDREMWAVMQERERLLENAAESFDADRYGELEDYIQQNDGYAYEARCGEILEGLQIRTELHREPLSVLSGGFKLRVLLGQTLAAKPDVLLLDEPTNHLDILSIRWLEKFLDDFKGCAMVVSHDHRFLNNVCTHILDVDYELVTSYKGNYRDFERAKKDDRDRKEKEIDKREKEIADHKRFVERFKAKPTKARQAKSKVKQIERIVIERLPQSSRRYPKFKFKACRPSGKTVVELDGIHKSFDDNEVLHDVSLRIQRGDRLAVIGPNGIGKSTLLKVLMRELEADSGTVEWGYETHPGYFSQDHGELSGRGRQTVQSWLWDHCPGELIGFVRGNLAQVLFQKDEVDKKIANLSGGEKARLIFAKLAVTYPNVLVLDEPTNHLDLEGIEALAEGLENYDGSVIFVSHDRWFVSRLATRILELRTDGIEDFVGTYEEYLAACGDDHLDVDAAILKARRKE
ncbi:MAG: ATP-binding cassette domain-containing protein [Acidobacteria bacterium]|nr:ATP-binding cassette domain-containing protein [Acidobacteriota bacterium]NIM61882.1 ATP-binding cassette domain-containing protein [Acidobacteriota bacterium]NIQ31683.1 ATP-binding cassette domain-containing protein [Acidobacteriota bacterium]NIQ86954.1 ATP-binding cassette domain-containing protein [Acidobacteriota bacterium]NIT12258.1 ATP-binding cassette domain-containing protein [Acidobacteriota bacterium]